MFGLSDFHRVRLGDKLDVQRYTVLRKLGYVDYSTVRLAFDAQYVRPESWHPHSADTIAYYKTTYRPQDASRRLL